MGFFQFKRLTICSREMPKVHKIWMKNFSEQLNQRCNKWRKVNECWQPEI